MPIHYAQTTLGHAAHAAAGQGHGTSAAALALLAAVAALGAAALVRRSHPMLSATVLASLLAGAIHALAAPGHLRLDSTLGALFVALAAFQAGWALLFRWRPSPDLAVLGASANLVALAVWAVSRTAGLPFGPDPGVPEAIGTLDALSVACQLIVVTGAAWLSSEVPAACPQPANRA